MHIGSYIASCLSRAARLGAAVAFGATGLVAAPSLGAAQGLFGNSVVQADVLPGWMAEDGSRIVALRLTMAEGWHTYWRIPGESGIAPRFDWSASQNVDSVVPIWPRPEIFEQNGYRSLGFEDELVLPLVVRPRNPNRPMALVGDLAIGVCRDTCVPADLEVMAPLRGAGQHDATIQNALEAAATPAERNGLSRTTCRVTPAERGVELTLRATLPRIGREEHIVMELPGTGYWVSDSRTWREGNDLVAQARVRAPNGGAIGINRSAVAFTVLGDDRMLSAQGCIGG